MDGPTLEVLKCPGCDAEVPFGDADVATCVYCHAAVPLPEAYRELRKATHADESARREAEHVLRTLDDPPWLFTRVAAAALDQNMFAFLLFYGIPAGFYGILLALRLNDLVVPRLGYPKSDGAPSVILFSLLVLILLVFTFVPRALGVYANRRAASRGALLSALAARPPKTAGGPSLCRTCGAPLFATEGCLVARCVYCRSDNAVHLQTRIVKETRKDAGRVLATAREAAESDRRERRETRKALLSELGRYTLRALVLGGLLAAYGFDDDRQRAQGNQGLSALGGVALVGLVAAFFFFIFRSGSRPDDDAAERRTGAGLPPWVGVVAPFGVWVGIYALTRIF